MGIAERKQREKERRKNEILRAAKIVFTSRGYQLATMKEIAEEAQLSTGTLYLYFKNKEELHAVLSMQMLQFLSFEMEKILQKENFSVQEKLDDLGNIFIKMYEYDAKVLIHLFHLQSAESLERLAPEIINEIKLLSASSLNAIASIIQEGMENGFFQKKHPVAIADAIWGTFSGVVLWVESKRQLNPEKDFVTNTLKTAMRIILEGLKRKESAAV